jgi:hypothetical protein
MVDQSQRNAARVYAVTYPLTFLIAAAAFYRFYVPLLVLNNAEATARNFVTHEQAFRMYLTAVLAHGVGVVVMLAALYVVFRPISQGLALFATLCRLMYAVMWLVQLLDLFGALRAAGGAGSLPALAGSWLASGGDAYYIGLGFYGLGTVVFACLWLRSRYVPRPLAAWGVLASLFMGFCGFAYLLFPGFGAVVSVNWYELPVALFELGVSVWLLVRGLRPRA